MRGWIFRIAIIAVIAGGAFIFRDRLSGSAGDLTVGDCFDVPANDTNVKDVQHHPCNESHTGEIFAVLTSPAANGAPPPTRAELISFLGTQCGTIFTQYTGIDVNAQDVLDYGAFYPSDKDWANGDRGVTCYTYRVDEAPMGGSVKK
ncbi:MAG: hypothetical protein QOI09_135 [Chloroflexota bacterium]|nr:hypothetical protein [Chloroflexota bacterium]